MNQQHSIENLIINFNPEGWGPIGGEKLFGFEEVPYAHFDKKDKVGRPADFVQPGGQPQKPHYKKRDEYSTDFTYKHDAAEDSTFQLVDTSKTQTKSKYTSGAKRQQGRQNLNANRGQQQGRFNKNLRPGQQDGSAKDSNKLGNNNRGKFGRGFRRQDRKVDRLPSLTVGLDWEMIEEFDLQQLNKLVANIPNAEDLLWCGHVDQYDETYDKITTRTAKPLRKIENKVFYDVTTSDDPNLERFAVDGLGDVYATDSIISQLMASPRSIYSWDILVQKVNGIIFLDKRDDDFLTVSETAHEPPSVNDETEVVNYPEKLSVEATMINQNYSQQVVIDIEDENRKAFEPNPFSDETDESAGEPASVAYRYRKFTLGNIRLISRCELHSWVSKRGEDQFITCHALNEWDSRYSGGVNWRQKIDQQRGAVLATELKNNSCKLAKWTAQALLAGAHQMNLGYVSRIAPSNNTEHTILATQFFKPKDLALQINLNINNIWGITKMICELLMSKPDGKYVLLKDPNKAIIRLYAIPLDSFEEEEAENAENPDENVDGEN